MQVRPRHELTIHSLAAHHLCHDWSIDRFPDGTARGIVVDVVISHEPGSKWCYRAFTDHPHSSTIVNTSWRVKAPIAPLHANKLRLRDLRILDGISQRSKQHGWTAELFFFFQEDMLFEHFVPESGGFLKHMLLVLKYRIPATTTSRVAINQRQFVSDSYQEPGVPTMTSPYIIAPVSILSPTVTDCRWTKCMASKVKLRCNMQLPGCDRHIVSTSGGRTHGPATWRKSQQTPQYKFNIIQLLQLSRPENYHSTS